MYKNNFITIVLPAYNAELTLNRCLLSIQKQTYKQFEVLMIDDGSTDSTIKIMNEYARKDSRFRIISQKHQGVSAARNLGIENTLGEFLCFIDADDTVDKNFLNILYNSAIAERADIIVYNMNFVYSNHLNRPLKFKNTMLNQKEYALALIDSVEGYINKMYKTSIVKQIRFNKKSTYHEDFLFNVQLLPHIDRVSLVNEYIYNYHQHNDNNYKSHYDKQYITSMFETDKAIHSIIKKAYPDIAHLYAAEFTINAHRILHKTNNSINKQIKEYIKFFEQSSKDFMPITYKIKLILYKHCYSLIELLRKIKHSIGAPYHAAN